MDYTLFNNHHLEEIDDESANLIIQLQLEDIENISPKSNDRPNDLCGISLALELQRTELENMASVLSNRRVARNMASDVQAHGNTLTRMASRVLYFAKDYTMTLLQSYPGSRPTNTTPEPETPSLPQAPTNDESTCVSCQNIINSSDAAKVPGSCGHEYCRACLETLFHLSMRDESFFPPRCCNESIAVASVHSFLKADTISAFAKKALEFETPNRIYCSSKSCSAFIHPTRIQSEIASCDECGTQTHTLCKLGVHTGDCPHDTVLMGVLDLARKEGWQRCYSCWSLVELEFGCNHMKCRCRAEFCYLCGSMWKSCSCPQLQEDRLVARSIETDNYRIEHRLLERPHHAVGHGAQFVVAVPARLNNPAREQIRWYTC
ncbi:uncharacterized protein EAF02_001678 [Botrytis sinoallii]|uniref:uncharacterized protein n=1 Tax=Botrytis sinoallii TaxID=1463999 RepID=UPI00190250E7|nr:uncharacterized protein EAF02_001678 [Botrytis sinoallii]KAF7891353.1 hypothetical protein EAF02_001678 [Botrytis sinoallii]